MLPAVFLSCSLAFAQDAAPAKGKETFLKLCASCHKPETVVSGRRTRSQWGDTLEKMVSRGAKGTEEEFGVVLEYLVANHGRVNVNRASVNEMVEVLGLTEAEATAIVKHRRANGKFEDFEGLTKVAGVDAARLEKNREAISF